MNQMTFKLNMQYNFGEVFFKDYIFALKLVQSNIVCNKLICEGYKPVKLQIHNLRFKV